MSRQASKSTSGCGACRSSRQTGVFAVLPMRVSCVIASHPSHRISHRIGYRTASHRISHRTAYRIAYHIASHRIASPHRIASQRHGPNAIKSSHQIYQNCKYIKSMQSHPPYIPHRSQASCRRPLRPERSEPPERAVPPFFALASACFGPMGAQKWL